MNGFVAPKDPQKQRSNFYIMLEKELFAMEQPNGKGVQFIYENDGRLCNSAQIVGNINNLEMLTLLSTVSGLRKLVYGIGISVMTENPEENIDFIFQMYGEKDAHSTGTNIKCTLKGNGAETRICLADVAWSDADDVPGQIRFEFDKPGILASANVRFFLNDGFQAPKVELDDKIDFFSENYQRMIQKSLMGIGNSKRIENAIKKAKEGKDVTIAYIGGSITQGAGATPINTECYAYKSYQYFAKKFGQGENVHYIKAGVGGTPSELGMLRFERDILRDGTEEPDIVVVEFAVNDEGDETKGICYESLVRKILNLSNRPGVILLFAVFATDWNLQERLSPVGKAYQLPMVSIMDAVTAQFRLKKEEGRVLSKNQFFYDVFHPSNVGHTIMADCLNNLLDKIVAKQGFDASNELGELDISQIEPVLGKKFESVRLLDRKDGCKEAEIECGSFEHTDTNLQCVEMDEKLSGTPEFPYNWSFQGNNYEKEFQIKIHCKALLLIYKDSDDVDFGKAEVFVDNKYVLTADPHQNGWVHCNPVIVFANDEADNHIIKVGMTQDDKNKKFTILGFGYVL